MAGWGVLALTAILYFTRLGARALWASEFRWAEIAREMIRTGNYFWPTINGHLYYDKPLGSYWLVLASTFVTGGLNETAARLPCAIAGLLAVGLLILLARRLYDLRLGVIAGFILATSFSFVFFSRCASADVETIAGELAALLLFLKHEDRRERMVGRLALDHHGDHVADQGPARLRAADHGDGTLRDAFGWMGGCSARKSFTVRSGIAFDG